MVMNGADCTLWTGRGQPEQTGSAHPDSSAQCLYCLGAGSEAQNCPARQMEIVARLVSGNFNQLGMDRMDNLLKDHTWNGFARFFDGLCISVLKASPLCRTGH